MSERRSFLVTGGAGFIGSHLVERALDAGHDVVVLDALTYAGRRSNVDRRARFVEGDIRDGALVLKLLHEHRVDACLNLAAESHVDRSITGPAKFIETNVVGTLILLNACLEYFAALSADRKARFRYLQVSTNEVFGSLGPMGRFDETSRYEPNSPYSASKAGADHLVRAWRHTYGLPVLTTNCSNNYGPRQFPEKLIPVIISAALADKPLPVYGDGGNVRDWIHVQDHCAGLLLALERGRIGATYCFGGSAERSNLELVRSICGELDRLRPRSDGRPHESRIEFVTDRPGHDRRYAIDDSRAQRESGFRASTTLRPGSQRPFDGTSSMRTGDEGHRAGWRQWHSAVSADRGRQQAAPSRLR